MGRLPVVVGLDPLDKRALIRILTEPKNAIVKQYRKFFELDKVDLIFTEDALEETATQALGQKTGARGLRTIVEEVLLDIMYDIPSRNDIKSCTDHRQGDPEAGGPHPRALPASLSRRGRSNRL